MNLEQATNLFRAFYELMETYADLAGEGNSGEFHDEKESIKIQKQLKEKWDNFVFTFHGTTGFKIIPIVLEFRKGRTFQTYQFNFLFEGYPDYILPLYHSNYEYDNIKVVSSEKDLRNYGYFWN